MLDVVQHFLMAEVHGAVVEARAAERHQYSITVLQFFVLVQFSEAGVAPALVEVGR